MHGPVFGRGFARLSNHCGAHKRRAFFCVARTAGGEIGGGLKKARRRVGLSRSAECGGPHTLSLYSVPLSLLGSCSTPTTGPVAPINITGTPGGGFSFSNMRHSLALIVSPDLRCRCSRATHSGR